MAIAEAEEGVKVEVAGELDAQVPYGDACDGGIRCVADGEAVAERAEQLLDGVGAVSEPPNAAGLIRRHRSELSDAGLGLESASPANLR